MKNACWWKILQSTGLKIFKKLPLCLFGTLEYTIRRFQIDNCLLQSGLNFANFKDPTPYPTKYVIEQFKFRTSKLLWNIYTVFNLDFVIILKNVANIETSLLDKFLALPLKSGCLFSLTFLFEKFNILSASKDILSR